MRRKNRLSMGSEKGHGGQGPLRSPVSVEGEDANRLAFELSRIGIVFLDVEGRILNVNPEMNAFLGYADGELVGRSILEVTHPDDLEASREFIERTACGSGQSFQLEKRYCHKRGHTLWGLVTCSPICDTKGLFLYLISHVQDISEQKRLEADRGHVAGLLEILNEKEPVRDLIRKALLFLQSVSGCEAVGIRLRERDDYPYYETRGFSEAFVRAEKYLCATDLDGQLLRDTMGNAVLDCMCGNVLQGRFDPSKPFFTPYGSFRSNCTTELLATSSESDRLARTRNRCNGEGYESVALIPLRSGGEALGLLQLNDRRKDRFSPGLFSLLERLADTLAIALAERKARERLQESETRYRLITEAVTDYLYKVRLEEGRVVETRHGEGCVAVTGYCAAEFAEDPDLWLHMVAEPDRSAVLDLSRRAVAGEGDLSLEHRIVRKDGSIRWILNTLIPRRNMLGEVDAYEGFIQDITAHKVSEEALRERELRFRTLFECAPVPIWEEDFSALKARVEELRAFHADGLLEYLEAHLEEVVSLASQVAIVDVNQRTLEFFGAQNKEEISRHLEEYFNDSSLIVFARELAAFADGDTQFSSEIPIRVPGGGERILSLTAHLAPGHEENWSRVYVSFVDITERKRLERQLRASESRYRSIVEDQTEAILRLKPNGICSFVNGRFCEVFGKNRALLVGAAWFPETDPAGANVISSLISEPTVEKPVYETECRVRDGRSQWRWYLFVSRGLFDANGWLVEAQVTGHDITKQKLYEEALHKNQELTQRILRTVPNLVYIYDPVEKRNVFSNQDVENYLGYSAEQFRNMGTMVVERLLHPDDVEKFNRHYQELEGAGEGIVFELDYRMKHASGEWRYLHSRDTVFLRDAQGRARQILGAAEDVTERKRAESALMHAHDLMRYVIENANSAIAIHDRDLRYIYVSDRYLRDYHLKGVEVVGRSHYEVFPDLPQKWKDVHQRALAGVASSAEEDFYERADGSVVWTRWKCRPWYESDGAVGGIIIYTEVITKRKLMEQALRASENRFRSFMDNSPALAWAKDETGRLVYYNRAFLAQFGIGESDWMGKVDCEIWPGEFSEKFRQHDLEVLSSGVPLEVIEEVPGSGGEVFQFLVMKFLFQDANGVRFVGGIALDITQRIRAEEQLRQYVHIVTHSRDLMALVNRDYAYLVVNTAFASAFSAQVEEVVGKTICEMVGGAFYERVVKPNAEVCMTDRVSVRYQDWLELPGTGKRYLDVVYTPYIGADGRVKGFVIAGRDITDRKLAEEALRASEERLNLALSSTEMGIFEWDTAQDLQMWDATAHRLLGTDPERFNGRSDAFFALMPPEDREMVREAHRRAMEEGTAYETEYRAIWPDGSVHHIAARGRFYLDSTGEPGHLLGVCWDITQRKEAEQALRASQQQYRLLFESMSSAFALHEVVLDGEGKPFDYRFLEVNPTFEKLTGLRKEQMIGHSVREVLPETEDFWIEQYGRVALTGEPVYFEHWSRTLGRYYEITAYSPQYGQFAVIFLDLTERKKMDEALKASWEQYRQLVTHLDTIREEERAGIAREIHDELGQALTGFRLDISKLFGALTEDQVFLREKLAGMVKDIEKTTDIVHRISSELRPGMLDDLGIGAAADWLMQDFESRTGLRCESRIEPEDLTLDQKVSTALYRILQEALTNIARHAQAGWVRARLVEQGDWVTLEIEDDGVGILPDQANHRQSWGIIGMQERVRALNGEFSISGEGDRGTRVYVRIPLAQPD